MGVDVEKTFRRWMFVVCAIIVASLVSVTGIIGFVGLMVPHMYVSFPVPVTIK